MLLTQATSEPTYYAFSPEKMEEISLLPYKPSFLGFFCYLRIALLKLSLISPKSSSTLLHLDHQHQQGHLFIITYCKQNKQKMSLTYALFQLPPHLSSRHSKTSPKSCLQIWSPLCYLPFSLQLTLHFHTSFSYHIYIT